MVTGVCFQKLNVFGDVDDHRSAPAGPGDVQGLVDGLFDFIHGQGHVGLLGNRHHDADHVAFLKGVCGNHSGGNLAGNGQKRNRIHDGVSYGGYQIHGAGARCRHADTGSRMGGAHRCPRYSLGHEGCSLLVARHDELEAFLFFHFVKDRHDGSAGIAEYVFDAFIFEGLEDQFCAFHGLTFPSSC